MTFSLRVFPPFRLDLTCWALKRRASNIIDNWDGTFYKKVMIIQNKPILVLVKQPKKNSLLLITTNKTITKEEKTEIKNNLKKLLGLSFNAQDFYQLAAKDPNLKNLAKKLKGLRPPRFLTLFEATCNAVACQQLSLTVGLTLLNRLATHYGKKVKYLNTEYYAFPKAQDIAKCKPHTLQKLGFSLRKSETIIQVAKILQTQELTLQAEFASMSDEKISAYLQSIKGIGRWSSEYILLRGLGRINVFPGDDIAAQKNLQRFLRARKPLNYAGVVIKIKPWLPYGGFIYMHLLVNNIINSEEFL